MLTFTFTSTYITCRLVRPSILTHSKVQIAPFRHEDSTMHCCIVHGRATVYYQFITFEFYLYKICHDLLVGSWFKLPHVLDCLQSLDHCYDR